MSKQASVRRWSQLSVTVVMWGHRRLLHRGRGQASSRQRSDRTVRHSAGAGLPTLALPSLAEKKDEEEKKKEKEVQEKLVEELAKLDAELLALLQIPEDRRTPPSGGAALGRHSAAGRASGEEEEKEEEKATEKERAKDEAEDDFFVTLLAVSEMLVVPAMYVVIFPVLSPFASVRTFDIVMDTFHPVLLTKAPWYPKAHAVRIT